MYFSDYHYAMREYIFSFEFDRGVHPVRDIFIDNSDLEATSLAISASTNTGWRVERIIGSENALDALEAVYLNTDICNECIYPHTACDARVEYEVIEHEPTSRTIYHATSEENFCYSVPSLAVTTLGSGLVFDALQSGPYYKWSVLVPSGRDLGELYDVLLADLPNGVRLKVCRIGTPTGWKHNRIDHSMELPHNQLEALEAAIELGYYERPRKAALKDIAEELGLPLTTLRYRLRRAEAWAVTTAHQLTQPYDLTPGEEQLIDVSTTMLDED